MRLFTSILLVILLGACGYKGPLTLPKAKPAPEAQPAPQPAQNTGKQQPPGQ